MDIPNVHLLWLLRAIAFDGGPRPMPSVSRKDGETPYVSQCFPRLPNGAPRLRRGRCEATLTAAVLYDTIEDTPTDFDDIEKGFGAEIAEWCECCPKTKRRARTRTRGRNKHRRTRPGCPCVGQGVQAGGRSRQSARFRTFPLTTASQYFSQFVRKYLTVLDDPNEKKSIGFMKSFSNC